MNYVRFLLIFHISLIFMCIWLSTLSLLPAKFMTKQRSYTYESTLPPGFALLERSVRTQNVALVHCLWSKSSHLCIVKCCTKYLNMDYTLHFINIRYCFLPFVVVMDLNFGFCTAGGNENDKVIKVNADDRCPRVVQISLIPHFMFTNAPTTKTKQKACEFVSWRLADQFRCYVCHRQTVVSQENY